MIHSLSHPFHLSHLFHPTTRLIDAGQLLNGIAGTVPISGVGLVSGLWFPNNQRATATGMSTIAGYLGVCVSFLTGKCWERRPELDRISCSVCTVCVLMELDTIKI